MSKSDGPGLPLHNFSNTLSPNPQTPPFSRSSSRQSQQSTASGAPRTSTYAILSPSDTADRLGTSLTHGLSPSEGERRLHQNGPNELPHEEPEPLWKRFIQQFQETLILLLLGSAIVSLFMGNLEDAISIAAAVTIVVTVGFVQEYRSEKSLEALNRLVPHYANLIRNGATIANGVNGVTVAPGAQDTEKKSTAPAEQYNQTVSASTLVVGDLVSFYTGDRIPADVRIIHCADLSIDESNLTGENEPVQKSTDSLEKVAAAHQNHDYASPASGTVGADLRLNEQTNVAFMGTLVRSGYGHGIVIGVGGATEFGAVSKSLEEIESPRTPLQMSMDRLGKDLSYMSFGVIGFIMLVGLWRGWKFLDMFQTGVSLAVAAIPEGLPIIVTVTLALGVFRMSRRHAIVKRLPSVETLGSVNVICSDKTGTLTMNHMTVTKLWHSDSPSPFDPSSLHQSHSYEKPTRQVLRIANVANNARLNSHAHSAVASSAIWASTSGDDSETFKSRWLGQPTDVAMLDLLDALGESDVRDRLGDRDKETPFSSERKWMGVIHTDQADDSSGSNPHSMAYIKGALSQVLKRCDTYITKDGQEVVLDEKARNRAQEAAKDMSRDGLRVLGFACGPPAKQDTSNSKGSDELFQGLAFAGLVGMSDPPRKNVDRSIRRLMAGGVKVIMITGDSEETAMAVSRKLGMPVNPNSAIGKPVINGEELDRMTDDDLSQAIATTNIFARTSPEHKMKIIRALQQRGDVVAMTGDGVNDAPALKKADIGVSMGRLGTDVAKEAADMILTDDDFSTILNAIEEGKGIFSNIQNFLTFQLSTSAAALSLVFLSTLFGFPNPLNAMQILWINILMDGPPAQSLGVEPVDPAVMSRPPRSKRARVLTRALIQRVLQSASIIMVGTILTYIYEMGADGKVTARDTTMTFTCFVLFDMFNALSCRSEGKSVLRKEVGFFSNKMFNYAVAGSLVGQLMVVYFPPLQRIFQTEALGLLDLIRLICTASCVFWADEARKFYKIRVSQRGIGGYSMSV